MTASFCFAGRFGDKPLARTALAAALRGTTYADGRTKTKGICDMLGLAPFTPHDLRRTAPAMANLQSSLVCFTG